MKIGVVVYISGTNEHTRSLHKTREGMIIMGSGNRSRVLSYGTPAIQNNFITF